MTVRDAARKYFDHGFVTIPILLDGTKAPAEGAGLWRRFITKKPTLKIVDEMFSNDSALAIICGHDGLEVIDFDHEESFFLWSDLLEGIAPGLLARLPVITTPDNGRHVYVKSAHAQGNQKLANAIEEFTKPFSRKPCKTKIETRGIGGYVLAPPSPSNAHEANREYVHSFGPSIELTPMVTQEEREHMLDCARSLNEVAVQAHESKPATKGNTLRPGDDFEARASWTEILQPHGWSIIRERGDVIHWQRPGKAGTGISATTGFCSGQFYCFSSSTQFDTTRKYNKFAVFTILNHGGDFTAATKDLRARGFGALAVVQPEPPPPMDIDAPMEKSTTAIERLTAKRLEEMMDDDPTVAFHDGNFERVAEMRSDRAEWVAICDLMRRKKQKQALNNALKEHDRQKRLGLSDDASWKKQLMYRETKDGPVLDKCLSNLIVILDNDASWKSCVRLDKFSNRIAVSTTAPIHRDHDQRWSDTDILKTKSWLEREYGIRPSTDDVHGAIVVVADTNSFNPLRDYVDNLPKPSGDHDGILDTFLIDFFGAPDTPLTRAIGAKWMISAIARAYRPGCKVDTVLILEGRQGLKKSRFLQQLCPETTWFTDGLSDFGSKDQAVEIEGKWIVELAEMKGFGKELDAIKAFITRSAENYRPPYARNDIHSPRKCVFAATVNPEAAGYLRDSTGNRRFWPIECTRQSPELTPELRDRLWAEAKERFEQGEKWWLDEDEMIAAAEQEQEKRVVLDAWHEKIEEFVSTKANVSIDEVLDSLRIEIGKRDHGHVTRVGRVLTMLKWSKYRPRTSGRRYRNPSALFAPQASSSAATLSSTEE